jgi:peptidyl-prolyl cis-trans isomerase C
MAYAMQTGMHRSHALALILVASSCGSKAGPERKALGSSVVLAQVDDTVITDTDLKELLARYANQPFVLARYSTPEKKKELLDSLIRYDVLAIEARKRGYEHDPEVQRVAKEKMVRLFTQHEIVDAIKPSDVPETDIAKYYKDHASEYVRPEAVRASQILVKDRAKAMKVLADAKALQKTDIKGFRDLVAKYSEDADSKTRGGDLTQFDRATTDLPKPVVGAAFALKEVGDISDLVSTDKGFVVLRLTDHRPALSRSLDEARPEIQRRLVEELRTRKKKDYVEEARKTMRIEINEDALAKLELASASLGQSHAIDGGAVVGNRP